MVQEKEFWASGKKRPQRSCPIVRLIQRDYVLDAKGKRLKLFGHQARILNHFFQPGGGNRKLLPKLPYRTVVYSCPKKSGKTEVAAAVTYAYARIYGGLCLSIANDKDQATNNMFSRILDMLNRVRVQDPERYEREVKRMTADEIEFHLSDPDLPIKETRNLRPNGAASIRAIPCDPAGEAGHERLALTAWDELWAYGRSDVTRRLWQELQPIPSIPYSMRLVTTYAGYYGESETLWEIYSRAINPDPHTDTPRGHSVLSGLPVYAEGSLAAYWDHECRLPWQTPEFLEEARTDPVTLAQPAEYKRLWENRWTTGLESFMDMQRLDGIMEQAEREGIHNAYP